VELDTAVQKILQGVARNRELIVFPVYARILWWLARFAPGLLASTHLKTIRELRKIRQA
jgi:hypothetical protein